MQTLSLMNFLDFDFDTRLERGSTLPSILYRDRSVLAHEKQNIFNATWQLAGRLDQVAAPGSYFTTSIAGESIIVVRDAAGNLRGFHNVCRHRAGEVVVGEGSCRSFQCSYHGWTYALDGSLIGTPDWEGVENFDRRTMGLKSIEVGVWEQFVFVRIDDASSNISLESFLSDVQSRLTTAGVKSMSHRVRRDYTIECNWKVYVDNYLEGYHIPIVHPSLMRELDYTRYRTITSRYSSLQDAPIRSGNDPGRRYNRSETQNEALYFWIFPNLMLNVYPDNLSTNLIVPLSAERTLTIFEWYFGAADKEKEEETLRLSDEIQQEDIRVCEAVQRGLNSVSYNRGRYSVKRENGLHHFHSLWVEFSRGEGRDRESKANSGGLA